MSSTRYPIRVGGLIWPQLGTWQQVRDAAVAADTAGLDSIWTWDHLYAIVGDAHQPIFEGWTTLAAWAEITERAALGLMVGANTFRNPGLVAKCAVTVDHASRGRCWLGLGGAWFEDEHRAYGIDFGSGFGQRLDWLDESTGALRRLLNGETVTSGEDGAYRFAEAIVQPLPYGGPGALPIMIGGSGEKKTLRLVAQYADESNLTSAPEELPRKLEALAGHCDALGRDRSEIKVSQAFNVVLAETHEQAFNEFADALAVRNIDLRNGDPEFRAMIEGLVVLGDPDEVGERLSAVIGVGLDGITVSAPANGWIPGRVELLGEVATKALG